jgi:hypothetical protein
MANSFSICQKLFENVSSGTSKNQIKEKDHSEIDEDEHFIECVFDETCSIVPCLNLRYIIHRIHSNLWIDREK